MNPACPSHSVPPPGPVALCILGQGEQFATFAGRADLGVMLRAHTMTRLARLIAQRVAEAAERHETSVRFVQIDTPWASAACLEDARRELAQKGYTVATVENEVAQPAGWRLSW